MAQTEKQALQEKIKNRYGDQVKDNRERLCASCVSWFGYCEHGLLPVTSKGQGCPYYRRKED